MSDDEIRDELMTLLVAGHETTATELAWCFERLVRHPDVLARLVAEIDAGRDEYVTATIRETLRRRPVLLDAAAAQGGDSRSSSAAARYEPGTHLVANAYLVQHDPEIYPEPYAFRPERFLESDPGTYTWIPFGGGRRRCVGASFAMLEMAIVLKALLSRVELRSAGGERRAEPAPRDHRQPLGGRPGGAGTEIPAGRRRARRARHRLGGTGLLELLELLAEGAHRGDQLDPLERADRLALVPVRRDDPGDVDQGPLRVAPASPGSGCVLARSHQALGQIMRGIVPGGDDLVAQPGPVVAQTRARARARTAGRGRRRRPRDRAARSAPARRSSCARARPT